MEHTCVFDEKVAITPKDMNKLGTQTLDSVILEYLNAKMNGKCSAHGYVVPGSLELISRSMGALENGRYTGNIVFHCQVQGKVYNPSNGVQVVGEVLKTNKMGLYMIYKDAIRILVPRDLHLGNEEFENIKPGDTIRVELRKSRFQINDPFILSIGVYLGLGADAEADEEETNNNSIPALAPA